MTVTYVLTNNTGKVRLLIPDTDTTNANLTDEEIAYFLSEKGNSIYAAAAMACKWLARKYAQKASFSGDGLSMQFGQRAQTFADRAKELEAELLGGIGSAPLVRQDGFHDNSAASEYESRTVFIEV